jgi:type III restriction enzyme
MTRGIDHLIISSPFEEPKEHWGYDRERKCFERRAGRRPAGYVMATPGVDSFDDPGIFVELPEVNRIRERVAAWRAAGWPGVTGTTKRLLEHWRDPQRGDGQRFFFCQLEAIETLIWGVEAPAAERQGIEIGSDGGPFARLCVKLATGTGKTVVMAMAIAWHVLNKVADPQDKRFARHVFVVAPGLTVRSRLQVLVPTHPGNYYDEFDVVPSALRERLRQGKVRVRNWHALGWETAERLAKKRSVDKRGPKSDEAWVREALGELAAARNLLVINDEAHHAWRVPAGEKVAGVSKAELEEATKWIGGLDRIHRARGVLAAYDFSATPFVPSGKKSQEEALFGWIVSDFGLSDAIESGLVKTPRVVIRDDGVPDAAQYRSKLFHIYPHVADDLNRKAQPHEPLPQLVTNAYYLLGRDWLETARDWKAKGAATPPVMITVCNRTETAARIAHSFEKKRILIDELCERDGLLHIDSKVLEEAEAREEAAAAAVEAGEAADADEGDDEAAPARKLTKQQLAEALRQQVDTVGRPGKPGAKVQNVISVGMLSEGWDAKTVTHIMGLRAFTSQLLCEQVVGRGLRRTSYDVDPATGLYEAEFVNIFGVPFTFLPHEADEGTPPPPPKPRTRIEPVLEQKAYEIDWPNVVRIDQVYGTRLALELARVPVLRLAAHETIQLAEIAPTVDGKADPTRIDQITLDDLGRRSRMQTIAFKTAAEVFDQVKPGWPGSREVLLGQLVRIVERFLASDRIAIEPKVFADDPLRRRILLTLNMQRIVQQLFDAIRLENTVDRRLVLDRERPIRSTGDMLPWYSSKPCHATARSHINLCVFDSTWEASEAFALDHHPAVAAWAKNDHLGFEVHYLFQGGVHKYRPDFLIRLTNGVRLVLETKGQESDQDRTKREFLREWVEAVNDHGGFGRWACDVSRSPSDLADVLARHGGPLVSPTPA